MENNLGRHQSLRRKRQLGVPITIITYLVEVDGLRFGWIELAVLDARACRHACMDDGTIPHAVPMFQGPLQDIR
jgi:hypothetical protein